MRTSMGRHRGWSLAFVVIAGSALVACGSGPNSEDERRLDIAVTASLLTVRPDGAVVDDEIDGTGELAQGDDTNLHDSVVTSAVLQLDTPAPMPSVIDLYLEKLEQGGWQDVTASCSSADSDLVILRAKRDTDGFTLSTAIDVSQLGAATRVTVRVQAPFHTSDGPEIEGASPALGCLDSL